MPLYCITGLPFVGRRSLFAEAFKHLREKPDYVFMRLVSTRPAADVDASVEVAVSDRDFLAYKEANTFVYTWTEQRGRETPYYYGIPASTVSALSGEKRVVLVLPQISKQVLSDIYVGMGITYPVRLIMVTSTPAVLLDRIKAAMLANTLPPAVAKHYGITLANPKDGKETPSTGTRPQSSDRRGKSLDAKIDEKLVVVRKKLTKMLSDAESLHPQLCLVHNNGPVVEALVELLKSLDLSSAPPEQGDSDAGSAADSADAAAVDLKTCPAEVYLQHTVAHTLELALSQLDALRPADPVEFLALHMLREAQLASTEEQGMQRIAEARESITTQVVCERLLAQIDGRV